MNPQTKKAARKKAPEIDALAASVSTLRFVLDNVTRINRNAVEVSVTVTTATATPAKITVTCKGNQARCEQIGLELMDTGKWSCQSMTDGSVKCKEL